MPQLSHATRISHREVGSGGFVVERLADNTTTQRYVTHDLKALRRGGEPWKQRLHELLNREPAPPLTIVPLRVERPPALIQDQFIAAKQELAVLRLLLVHQHNEIMRLTSAAEALTTIAEAAARRCPSKHEESADET